MVMSSKCLSSVRYNPSWRLPFTFDIRFPHKGKGRVSIVINGRKEGSIVFLSNAPHGEDDAGNMSYGGPGWRVRAADSRGGLLAAANGLACRLLVEAKNGVRDAVRAFEQSDKMRAYIVLEMSLFHLRHRVRQRVNWFMRRAAKAKDVAAHGEHAHPIMMLNLAAGSGEGFVQDLPALDAEPFRTRSRQWFAEWKLDPHGCVAVRVADSVMSSEIPNGSVVIVDMYATSLQDGRYLLFDDPERGLAVRLAQGSHADGWRSCTGTDSNEPTPWHPETRIFGEVRVVVFDNKQPGAGAAK